jgi:hypothetical protein
MRLEIDLGAAATHLPERKDLRHLELWDLPFPLQPHELLLDPR